MKLTWANNSFKRLTACIARNYKDNDGNEKTKWTPVGVAFLNTSRSGQESITLKLDALPTNGEITLFEATPRDEAS